MFRLNDPPLVITQHEHARLSGRLATDWGNECFDRPEMDDKSFNEGVTLHDWHYGLVDRFPLDDLEDNPRTSERVERWLHITRLGAKVTLKDPVADVVSKRHLRRLVSYEVTEEALKIAEQVERQVQARMRETGLSARVVEFADRITNFCDQAAFHLFRSSSPRYAVDVFAGRSDEQMVTLVCKVVTGREISVSPWPFGCQRIEFDLIGYEREGYPDVLEPRLLSVVVRPEDG